MLLFFFMVTTVMRETEPKIQVLVPEATEIKKLEKKSLVSNIYIGKPHRHLQKTFGSEPRIQLNDALQHLKISGTLYQSRESRWMRTTRSR